MMYKEFIEDFRSGYSVVKLAYKYNYTGHELSTIFNVLTADDYSIHKKNLDEKIASLYSSGLSVSQIAKRLYVSRKMIERTLNKNE